MTRTITLTSKATSNSIQTLVKELGGQKAKVVTAIAAIGPNANLEQLRKRCARSMKPKTLRARVRELRQMKLVSVKAIAA